MIEMSDMAFGFELEGLFYDPNDFINIQCYHSGEFGRSHFKFESDSSVEPDEDDREYDSYIDEDGDEREDEEGSYSSSWKACELINRPMCDVNIHEKYVEKVQNYLNLVLCRNVSDMEMSEFIYFNDTCGFHVHFSVACEDLLDTVYYDFIQNLRETFFERLQNSEIINDNSKELIRRSYYRCYAERMLIGEFCGRHGQEFNYDSYVNGRGFEWRSPSLQGIKTWAELIEMVKIITETIVESLNKREMSYSEVFACVI